MTDGERKRQIEREKGVSGAPHLPVSKGSKAVGETDVSPTCGIIPKTK